MASYSTSYSQVLDNNCIFIEPADTTGVRIENFQFETEDEFPNWNKNPFKLSGVRKYGAALGNKMEIVLDSASFLNFYTAHHPTSFYQQFNGIDNKSMREFAKEKYRKEVLEKFLKDSLNCTQSNNYYVFSFITKKECNRERICRFRLGELACCSDSLEGSSFDPSENDHIEIINNIKYLIVKRKISCNEFSCCEERYHYVCNPNDPNPNSTWVFSYKDFTPYVGKECPPQAINNPNCPMNYPSTCKSGCGSN